MASTIETIKDYNSSIIEKQREITEKALKEFKSRPVFVSKKNSCIIWCHLKPVECVKKCDGENCKLQ